MTTLASFAQLLPLVYTHRINLKLIDLQLGRVYDLLGYDRDQQTLLTWNSAAMRLEWIAFEVDRYQFSSDGSPALSQAIAGEHPADFAARFNAVFAGLKYTIFTAQGKEVKVLGYNTNLAGDAIQLSPWVVVEFVSDGHRETLYYSKDWRQINFLMLSAAHANNIKPWRIALVPGLLDPLVSEPGIQCPSSLLPTLRNPWPDDFSFPSGPQL